MSLSITLAKSVDDIVNKFISLVASEYKLDEESLKKLWDGKQIEKLDSKSVKVTQELNSNVSFTSDDNDKLLKHTKNELIALCKKAGVRCTGTKVQLVEYLTDGAKTPIKKTPVKNEIVKNDVVKKLTLNIPVVPVRRNDHGNYEHPESSLVFNHKTQEVIGTQNSDGSISELTEDDIENCKKFKFNYILPSNLDKTSTLDDVEVDELDDDEIEVEEIEEIEDEELVEEEEEEEYEEEEYEEEN